MGACYFLFHLAIKGNAVRKIKLLLVAFVCVFFAPVSTAEVIVVPVTSTEEITNHYEIPPQSYQIIPLPGAGNPNDTYSITIQADNAVYKDITAYLVDAPNANLFSQRSQYRGVGYQKAIAPFTIQGSTQTPGPHYLILDNTYAAFITKKLNVSIKAAFPMGQEQVQGLKTSLTAMYEALKKGFVFKDFNIHVEPCGQVNAFSESSTSGDIHICTELLDNVSRSKNQGAFTFIFLHELGHTLLGLWGLPGNNNEDVADEFATYMMLQGNASSGALLVNSLDFWRNRDSMGEAINIVKNGDRHSPSIQRIRNIQENINNSVGFSKRWNRQIYPHMTPAMLNEIITKPTANSDVDLARAILNGSSPMRPSEPLAAVKSTELPKAAAQLPAASQSQRTVAARLKDLKKLLKDGLISQGEFEEKKKEILSEM